MPNLTAGGYPYVLPDEHPLEYPAVSQQLAQKLESDLSWFPFGQFGSSGTATTVGPTSVVLASAGSASDAQCGITFDAATHSFVVDRPGVYLLQLKAQVSSIASVSVAGLAYGFAGAQQAIIGEFYVPASTSMFVGASWLANVPAAGTKICAMGKSSVSRSMSYVSFVVAYSGVNLP